MQKEVHILNVLVDNSNVNYPNAIIKVWWRLNCYDDVSMLSYQCCTSFSPVFDENYISYENVTNQQIIDWIKTTEGMKYQCMEHMIEYSLTNERLNEGHLDNTRYKLYDRN